MRQNEVDERSEYSPGFNLDVNAYYIDPTKRAFQHYATIG